MRLFRLALLIVAIFFGLVFPKGAYAVAFDLIPPSGVLQRGQDIQFIIDLDTQGQSLTTVSVGLQYDPVYLQYKSAVQGDALTSLTVTQQAGNILAFTGYHSAGFNGIGTFATVTFTLIAQAAGSTELCTLVETNPTAAPTATPVPVTNAPRPTTLPQTGQIVSGTRTAVMGALFLTAPLALYLWFNRKKYDSGSGTARTANPKKHA